MQAFRTLHLLCFLLLNNVVLHHAQEGQLHGTVKQRYSEDFFERNSLTNEVYNKHGFPEVLIELRSMDDPDNRHTKQELLNEIKETGSSEYAIAKEPNKTELYAPLYLTMENEYSKFKDTKSLAGHENSRSLSDMLALTCPLKKPNEKRKKRPKKIYKNFKNNKTRVQRPTSQPTFRRTI